jgi:murein DD-endopeptidase MepM/ murein hydrolase activator NlpD
MSAYAHAAILLVKRGDVVRRGQVIARVGRTGSVSEPQLHFELRRGDRAVDPRRYLVRFAFFEGGRRFTSVASPGGRPGPG